LISTPPQIALTDLKIAGKSPHLPTSLQKLKSFQLSHSDYFFTLSFSALDFIDPSKNQYSYKLENFDSDWVDNGSRTSATYTNLPPGNYTFRVRGANSVGTWNLEGASIDVQVLPPWWRTWWAVLSYLIAAIAAILYAKKIYDDRLIAKQVAVRAEQMQLAADRANDDLQERLEIQDELVRSVYKHNLNTLSLVKHLHSIRADLLDDASFTDSFKNDQNRLAALGQLESCVLYQDEVLYANLHKYTDMVIDLVLKTSAVPVETITTINDVSKKAIPVETATPLSMIIFELLSNCVSHAFESRAPAHYIQISLDFSLNALTQNLDISLVVSDDGVGLPVNVAQQELESTGLMFVRSIVDKLRGELTISAGSPGTTVKILISDVSTIAEPEIHHA